MRVLCVLAAAAAAAAIAIAIPVVEVATAGNIRESGIIV